MKLKNKKLLKKAIVRVAQKNKCGTIKTMHSQWIR